MSMRKDELASGHGKSSFAAEKILGALPARTPAAKLEVTSQGVKLALQAGKGKGHWFAAEDGWISGWLEAFDGEKWRPIEARWGKTCGNSYHRVFLESGYQWRYEVKLPSYGPKRKVRWRSSGWHFVWPTPTSPYQKPEGVVSNEVEMLISDTRFMLPAHNRHYYTLGGEKHGAIIGVTEFYRPPYAAPPPP